MLQYFFGDWENEKKVSMMSDYDYLECLSKRMSTIEIAELTGKEHDQVKSDILAMEKSKRISFDGFVDYLNETQHLNIGVGKLFEYCLYHGYLQNKKYFTLNLIKPGAHGILYVETYITSAGQSKLTDNIVQYFRKLQSNTCAF